MPDGRRSENERPQQVESEPRHQESVRCRWQQLCFRWPAKPNLDNLGFSDARIRLHGGANACGELVRTGGPAAWLLLTAFSLTSYAFEADVDAPKQPIEFNHKLHV